MANLQNNRLSMTLTPEQMTDLKAYFQHLNEGLSFLQALTPTERRSLPKIDSANKTFVEDAITCAHSHSDILPTYIQADEVANDLMLYRQLDELLVLSENITSKLRDTQMLAGSEAFSAALMIYRTFDSAAKSGIPNAQSAHDMLKQRFKGQGPSAKTAAKPETQTV